MSWRIGLAVALLATVGCATDSYGRTYGSVSVSGTVPVGNGRLSVGFYDQLAPYGDWIDYPPYGRVWRPSARHVGADFTPYVSNGRWVYSDYGWTFASQYDWGWAPFHYGRWFHDPRLGWAWVPGNTWGPAWVDWRVGGDVVGWAPLPPERYASYSYAAPWYFASYDAFASPQMPYYVVRQPARASYYYQRTRPLRRWTYNRGVRYHAGPPPENVVRYTREEVPRVRVAPPVPGRVSRVRVYPPARVAPPVERQRVRGVSPPTRHVAPPSRSRPVQVAPPAQGQRNLQVAPPSQPPPKAKRNKRRVHVAPPPPE